MCQTGLDLLVQALPSVLELILARVAVGYLARTVTGDGGVVLGINNCKGSTVVVVVSLLLLKQQVLKLQDSEGSFPDPTICVGGEVLHRTRDNKQRSRNATARRVRTAVAT